MALDEEQKKLFALIYEMPIFRNLDPKEQQEISKLLQPFSAAPLEKIIEKKQLEDRVYFIKNGRMEATFSYDGGTPHTFSEGMVVNEIGLFDNRCLPTTLTAVDNTTGYYINVNDFKVLQEQYHSVVFKILKNVLVTICRNLRKVNTSIISMIGTTEGAKPSRSLGHQSFQPSKVERESIRALPCFEKFTDEELKELLDRMEGWSIVRGNIIFSEGEPGRSCFILVKGAIEVSINEAGRQFRLVISEPGSFFGEVSLIHLGLRSATCTASEDSVVLELTKNNFDRFINTSSLLSYKFLEVVAKNLIRAYIHASAQIAKEASKLFTFEQLF